MIFQTAKMWNDVSMQDSNFKIFRWFIRFFLIAYMSIESPLAEAKLNDPVCDPEFPKPKVSCPC